MLLFANICSLSLTFFFCGAAEKIGVFGTSTPGYRRPSTSCGGFAGVELHVGLGSSSANSPHADANVCRVVAEEEGGDAG
jgi:hypothetical protein